MKVLFIIVLLSMSAHLHAQDEMSQEINKLETGNIENKKNDVPQDPTDSANQVEKEIDQNATQPIKPEANPAESAKEAPAPEAPSEDSAVQEVKPDQPETTETPAPVETKPEEDVITKPDENSNSQPVEQTETPPEAPKPEPIEEPTKKEEPAMEQAATPAPTQKEAAASDFEQRLNHIYNKFYAESTSDQVWTQIAGEKIKETYTLQPGDTLWDVSVTFFGNGFYWSKIWAMNDDITNPHEVSTGYVLKFTPGKIDKAPQINLTKNDQAQPATPVKTDTVAANVLPPSKSEAIPLIPPPDTKHVPVLKQLPPSLPYISGPQFSGYDSTGFSVENKGISIKEASVFLPSYLSEEEPQRVGKVVEFDEDTQTNASLYETVYVRFESPVQIGDRFITYHLDDKVYDFHGNNEGRPIVLEGEIKILALVNSDKNVYKAKILQSVNFVSQDSYVMKGSLIKGDTSETDDSSNVAAEIVGGSKESTQIMAGDQEIIYLGKGSQGGVKEGQTFDVYKNMEVRKSSTYVRDLKEKIGRIKIIKTTPERSTAIVLHSSSRILPGDYIGAKEISRNDDLRDTDFGQDQETSKNTSEDLEKSDDSPSLDQKSDSDDDLLNQ